MVAYSGLCIGSGTYPPGDQISLQNVLGIVQEVRTYSGPKDRQRSHCYPERSGEHTSDVE